MNSGTQEASPFKINLTHDVGKINDAIGFFPKAWRTTKKYSVNNALSIAAVNTWLQFSLAYVAAVIITSNDVSFITNILNSQAMPAYALASVILGVVLLTSLAIKHIYKQEIKDERLKDGKSTIDRKIRSGHSDGINEIAQNALIIEIIPDLGSLVDKKQSFSIVLPISGKQGEILENKRQENRNKIILLTVPYVLSGLIVVGALAKFGFAHIRGWEEWTFIAVVGIVAIAGTYITLSKLRNNEVDNNHNTVKKFNNLDVLLPFRKGSVVSVMENKFESKEKDDLQSQGLKLFERFLTNFKNDVCSILDEQLAEANKLLKKDLLDPSSKNIQEALKHIREDLKKDLDGLHKEFSEILNNGKGPTEDVNSPSVADIIKEFYSKLKGLNLRSYIGYFTTSEKSSDDSEFSATIRRHKEEAEQLQNEVKKLKKQLEELKNKQAQPNESNSSLESDLDKQRNEEKKVSEENKLLKSQQRTQQLKKENAKLEKELSEQEKTDGRQEKINGKASEFLYYLLESIKLEGKSDQKEKVSEATLRNFNNKIIIHWKDGSQTTCHIKKQGDLPSTKVDFADQNIHAAFAVACAG